VLQKVKEASRIVSTLNGNIKRKVLKDMAKSLIENSKRIIEENKKDLAFAKENNLTSALIDRLYLDEKRIESMANALTD